MAGININQGTQTNVATDAVGTVNYQIIKLDRGAAGASSLFTGTVDAVTNLATGTVSTIGLSHPNYWGTVVSSGTSTMGTIKAAVAGSVIYVTDVTISVGSASNVSICSGTSTIPILGSLFFNANGGLVGNYNTPLQTVSGSALVYIQSANGPLTIQAAGYVK